MKKTPSGRLVLPGGVFASLGDMLEVAQSLIDVGDVGKGVGNSPENIVMPTVADKRVSYIPDQRLSHEKQETDVSILSPPNFRLSNSI